MDVRRIHRGCGLPSNAPSCMSEPDLGSIEKCIEWFTKNTKFGQEKNLRSEEGQRVPGQTTTSLFPPIHPQLPPFTNESYPPVRSVPPDEFLDSCQCHLEFLEPNLRVLIDGLQVGFPEAELFDFGEFAILVGAVVDVGRLREEQLWIRLAP